MLWKRAGRIEKRPADRQLGTGRGAAGWAWEQGVRERVAIVLMGVVMAGVEQWTDT